MTYRDFTRLSESADAVHAFVKGVLFARGIAANRLNHVPKQRSELEKLANFRYDKVATPHPYRAYRPR